MAERRRQHLGPVASAAVPMVWAIMRARDWTLADLARQLDEDSGRVTRWAYGDRKPGRRASASFALLGISADAWDAPMPARWKLPHAKAVREARA